MKTLYVTVSNKVAVSSARNKIVCGNSDYQIQFAFDSEWDAYEKKTARFVIKGTYKDVEFTGTICPVPQIINTEILSVGVYAGDIYTTTAATIPCVKSIRCEGVPAEGFPIPESGINEDELNAMLDEQMKIKFAVTVNSNFEDSRTAYYWSNNPDRDKADEVLTTKKNGTELVFTKGVHTLYFYGESMCMGSVYNKTTDYGYSFDDYDTIVIPVTEDSEFEIWATV